MSQPRVKVGIIGCGAICGAYLHHLTKVFHRLVEVTTLADLDVERAKARATEFGVARACTVDELLRDPEIKVVVNLTVPKAHASVALAAVAAGKSVFNEKPLTVTRKEGLDLLAAAAAKGVRVGAAPDTFLGASIQTCRKLIDDGWIGRPIGATAFMTCRGHETWHPSPEFYYEVGGGPMFDMGPYYLTALVNLLGPVARVTGMTSKAFEERTITSQPKFGKVVPVEIPTHVAGIMEFTGGAVGTILTSFDVYAAVLPRIEIYGTDGSLSVPDPNGFVGPIKLFRPGNKDWVEMPQAYNNQDNGRGIGATDMAVAIAKGRPHRANGELAYHVLDLMHAFHDAATSGQHVKLQSTCTRPALLPTTLRSGELD